MAFKRKEAVIEAVDLAAIAPEEAEKRVIQGVKRYATNEANWSSADRNTPYLGSIVGMGIESSNLADITMSVERQFLTRKTRRVPLADGSTEFRLEDGELGKLRILDGEDALAATPGLTIKMLMDLGHMPRRQDYLDGVIPFADIQTLGDGHRLNDALKKTILRVERLSGPERQDASANLASLARQAADYIAMSRDQAALAASRAKIFHTDEAAHKAVESELRIVSEKLRGLSAANEPERLASAQGELAEIKARLRMSAQKLRISREGAAAGERRTPATDARYGALQDLLAQSRAQAEKLAS